MSMFKLFNIFPIEKMGFLENQIKNENLLPSEKERIKIIFVYYEIEFSQDL